ncbi:hypothetical protein Pan54_21020 [Rubinisphaera italica]|uniref:Uncharacterized protein n=1 Tax=Rubinisphaera italica TaxID=2527969 RepID=A0A5C5XE27_9PLAN|nr:hypothetical protein Pan54_21020 [Rubinisphaera italica]
MSLSMNSSNLPENSHHQVHAISLSQSTAAFFGLVDVPNFIFIGQRQFYRILEVFIPYVLRP